MNKKTDAIIVAAGLGTRLGFQIPKAFVPLHNRPLLSYSLETFLSHDLIKNVILVIPETMFAESIEKFSNERIKFVIGGKERWESVRNGIKESQSDWVLVHDAARPFVTKDIIDSIIAKRSDYRSVITVTPVVDTIRFFSNDTAGATVDREKLVRVGTPQLFERKLLNDLFDQIKPDRSPPTDEAILVQNAGIQVGISWGDPNNFKITTKADLEMAQALLTLKEKK